MEAEVWFPADVSQNDVRDVARSNGAADARIQQTGDSAFKIRAEEPDNGNIDDLRRDLEAAMRDQLGAFFVLSSAGVSGILSAEIAADAGIALIVAAIAILIYISLAFRRLANPGLYGAAAIVALLHDITIVVGAFAILGRLADTEVNAMFVTALLAIIGYSRQRHHRRLRPHPREPASPTPPSCSAPASTPPSRSRWGARSTRR